MKNKQNQQENAPQTDYEKGLDFGYDTAKAAFANRSRGLRHGDLPKWPEGITDHESFNDGRLDGVEKWLAEQEEPAPEYATVVSVF